MKANSLPVLLTIESPEGTIRRVWDRRKPMDFGPSPGRWRLEECPRGVRLRGRAPGQEFLFSAAELTSGVGLIASDVAIKLKSAARLKAAHAYRTDALTGRLRVYPRAAGWALDSVEVNDSFVGYLANKVPAFELKTRGATYLLIARASGVVLRRSGANHELPAGREILISVAELTTLEIHADGHDWSFNRPEFFFMEEKTPLPAEDSIAFRKSLKVSGVLGSAFILVSLLLAHPPAPVETKITELATITLEPALKMKIAAAASGGMSKKGLQQTDRSSAPAAFQGDKLQTAMRGLFRGGMTKLLAQSEYGSGSDGSESTRKLFNSTSPALRSTAPITGPGTGSGIKVAALGGDGKGSGRGIGYGQGEHANVNGQGRSLVSMDTTGSNVEEGLTRDEVGEVIHRHLSEVRYCYESSMLKSPDLQGKLVMGFTINGAGAVKMARVRNSTLGDSSLDDCILRRLNAWRFPRTKGGIDVAVTYPFIFKTLGG